MYDASQIPFPDRERPEPERHEHDRFDVAGSAAEDAGAAGAAAGGYAAAAEEAGAEASTSYDNESPLAPAPAKTPWDLARRVYSARFPHVENENVLALIWKLDENPDRNLADVKPELEAYGLKPSARALGSARIALGLIQAKPRKSSSAVPRAEPEPESGHERSHPGNGRGASPRAGGFSVKDLTGEQLRALLAGGDAKALVEAMEQAIEILQAAVDRHRERR